MLCFRCSTKSCVFLMIVEVNTCHDRVGREEGLSPGVECGKC